MFFLFNITTEKANNVLENRIIDHKLENKDYLRSDPMKKCIVIME